MAEPDGMRHKKGAADEGQGRADGGLGDDQGTRVGSPDAASGANESGATESGATEGAHKGTGAGAEAAEGIHSTHGRDQAQRSGSKESREAQAGDADRAGSEPLRERETEHQSGYGGDKGEPKRSSHDR